MTAFKGLYMKELKLSLTFFFINLGLINLITLASIGLKEYFDAPMIPAILFFVLLILHTFYLPAILLSSLQIEAQSQLWLHTSKGGAKLFLAKIAAGLTYFVVSLFFSLLLAQLAMGGVPASEEYASFKEFLNSNLMSFSGMIIALSIYIGVWILFYWTLYHSLKGIPLIHNIRWLVIFAVWLFFMTIGDWLSNVPTFQVYMEKETMGFSLFNTNFVASVQFQTIGMYVLIAIAVFWASVWLLERKVEV